MNAVLEPVHLQGFETCEEAEAYVRGESGATGSSAVPPGGRGVVASGGSRGGGTRRFYAVARGRQTGKLAPPMLALPTRQGTHAAKAGAQLLGCSCQHGPRPGRRRSWLYTVHDLQSWARVAPGP